MNTALTPVIWPEKRPTLPLLNTALPGWKQLPAERQRELVLSLAAMVVKQLATDQLPQEVGDD
jgi:hypothetical protein